ncbi:formyltransferase family protein [Roseovarius sp. S1116L3]|uniref:formyltransferase family protein n=1 Tax=Roseovarius roseus TaxID=3342636 RepID=UPI0037271353
MKTDAIYPYASGDLLCDRNTYFYSQYHGAAFLDAWARQRASALRNTGAKSDLHEAATPTVELIRKVRAELTADAENKRAWKDMDRLVQRFEVTKRVHDAYGENWRAVDPARFHAANAYIELSEAFAQAYRQTGALTYLNALLKILDTQTSFSGGLSKHLQDRLADLMKQEADFVASLRAKVAARRIPPPPPAPEIDVATGALQETVLLACDSARSRAYIQAMCRLGMPPSHVYLMGAELDRAPDGGGPASGQGIFALDLAERITTTCARAGLALTQLPDRDVNSDATIRALTHITADLVVYSGVGGQIVSERALSAGPRFLHMHSGWLPDYRGSTTLYYAILNGEHPGVTSIILDPGIDTGPVVLRQKYSMPDKHMDVDQLYDAAIRADTMCRTLAHFAQQRAVSAQLEQCADQGRTYFVIHPILKHIALLSLGED